MLNALKPRCLAGLYRFILIGIITLMTACSWTSKEKSDAEVLPPLDVPPDLLKPTINEQYVPPVLPAAAPLPSATQEPTTNDSRSSSDLPRLGEPVLPPGRGVQRVRDGQRRWLIVSAEPEQAWPLVRKFLTMRGYSIARDEPAIGLLETDWKDRFDDTDHNGLPNWRERLRIRLEPAEQAGKTEVYVSQNNSERVTEDGQSQWQIRAPDNERSVEMMDRLARYLVAGNIEDVAPLSALVSNIDTDEDGRIALRVEAGFELVWRRTALALDALGFVIEDHNRASRTYRIYNEVSKGLTEEELQHGKPQSATMREEFQLRLHEEGEHTLISVQDKLGRPDQSKIARHLLSQLRGQFK